MSTAKQSVFQSSASAISIPQPGFPTPPGVEDPSSGIGGGGQTQGFEDYEEGKGSYFTVPANDDSRISSDAATMQQALDQLNKTGTTVKTATAAKSITMLILVILGALVVMRFLK